MVRKRDNQTKRSRPASAKLHRWLTLVFLFSGAAGLGYQVVWARLFSTGVGHEYPAVLAVVSAFMAGIALGAFCFERLPSRVTSAPTTYGWLELGIGAWGLVSMFLIPAANDWVIGFLGVQPGPVTHWLTIFVVVLLCLLPGTAAMGATLPAIELTLTAGLPRRLTGLLYGANTAGAVLGAIASAYWVMPALGVRGTVILFSLVNLVCGAVALGLTRKQRNAVAPAAASKPRPQRMAPLLLLTGFLGIGYEVLILRVLSHALENTIFTFALVLGVYLAGTALGAFAYHRLGGRVQGHGPYLLSLAFSCVLCGIAARWLHPVYGAAREFFGDTPGGVFGSELLTTMLLFALPSFLMGATFAHLAEGTLRQRRTLGWAVSLNTLGAAFAPPLFGTLLFPWLGTRGTLWLVALGYALLIPALKWKVPTAMAILALGLALPRSADLIERAPGTDLIALENGVLGTVAVLQETNGHRVLKVNNRFQMGGTAAGNAEQRHADIPLLLHPAPRRAAFLGLGTGITFAAALNHPGLKADGVELVPAVAELMPFFVEGRDLFNTPPLQTYVADARRFIEATETRYDVIVGDLFHPAQDGTGFLYTLEHFAAVRERLAPGGLFCQWLPLYQLDEEVLRSITRTFLEVFPHTQAWLLRLNIETPVLGLIGFLEPSEFDGNWVERRLDDPTLAAHLRKIALADSVRLFGLFAAGPRELQAFSAGAPQNTYDHPFVMFHAPEFTYQRGNPSYATLRRFLDAVETDLTPLSLPGGENGLAGAVSRYLAARDVYLAGLFAKAEGEVPRAVEHFIQSARLSPDFTSGYAQGITLATALATTNPSAAKEILRALAEAQPERGLAQELLRRLGLDAE